MDDIRRLKLARHHTIVFKYVHKLFIAFINEDKTKERLVLLDVEEIGASMERHFKEYHYSAIQSPSKNTHAPVHEGAYLGIVL